MGNPIGFVLLCWAPFATCGCSRVITRTPGSPFSRRACTWAMHAAGHLARIRVSLHVTYTSTKRDGENQARGTRPDLKVAMNRNPVRGYSCGHVCADAFDCGRRTSLENYASPDGRMQTQPSPPAIAG